MKSLAGAIYMEEKWRNGDKKVLDNLGVPKLQETFTTVAIVCRRYERLSVLQNFFAILLLFASEGVEKRFGELYTRKIKKKTRSRDEK